MAIPAFKDSYQSGPYIDLMPHSFFDGDTDTQATYFRNRASLLVDALRYSLLNLSAFPFTISTASPGYLLLLS